MLGMRLRIKGESQLDNVKQLFTTIPTITSMYHSLRLCFDRGYGKMAFIIETAKKNYNLTTIANDIGSRHPFILWSTADSKIAEWRGKKVTKEEIDRRVAIFRKFVLEATEFGGPSVRVATKVIKLNQHRNKKIYATAIRDIFDKNKVVKYLQLFSTGEEEAFPINVWVSTQKNVVIKSNTLFSDKKCNAERAAVETHLLQTCNALTISQCCGDWFNQKSF